MRIAADGTVKLSGLRLGGAGVVGSLRWMTTPQNPLYTGYRCHRRQISYRPQSSIHHLDRGHRRGDGCVITPVTQPVAPFAIPSTTKGGIFGVPGGTYLLGFVAGFLTFGAGVRFGGGAEAGISAADEGLAARRCIEPNRSPQIGS